MAKEILISIESKETRCAFLKNGMLHDLVIERSTNRPLTGNVYRGYVVNTLQEIRSSFVDIGEEKNGFIPDSDILENIQKFQEIFGMDFEIDLAKVHPKRRGTGTAKLFKPDQPVLVQVVKEPTGSKGARLTSNISIPGRHLVLIPNTPIRVVSRKMNDSDRQRLQKLIQAFEMPQDMGLICRTASANASEEQLIQEAHDLLATWKEIMEKFEKSTKPTCLFEESDLIKRTLLTAIDKQYQRILVDDPETLKQLKQLQEHLEQRQI